MLLVIADTTYFFMSVDVDGVWDTYINSHIIDSDKNVWAGPNAISLPMMAPIHIITACNPHETLLSDLENTRRNLQLENVLCSLNVKFQYVVGTSSDLSWQENSFAVSGLNRSKACELARTYHQRAIFELTDNELLAIDSHSMKVRRKRSRLITLSN